MDGMGVVRNGRDRNGRTGADRSGMELNGGEWQDWKLLTTPKNCVLV